MSEFKISRAADFFKDKDGRIVMWQWPNALLYGWVATKIVTFFLADGHLKHAVSQLGTAILFTWAFLEITKGASYFRRALGAVVMAMIVIGFFRK